MGSDSDWRVMDAASAVLTEFGIPHEVEVVSAHRTPDKLMRYGREARGGGSAPSSPGPGERRTCRACWHPSPPSP